MRCRVWLSCGCRLTRLQDMIHRASMGNFTAPSMRPGGTNPFFPLVYCSSSDTRPPRLVPRGGVRRRHQQLRRAGGSRCTPHAAARTPSTYHFPLPPPCSAGQEAKTLWMTSTPRTSSRALCAHAAAPLTLTPRWRKVPPPLLCHSPAALMPHLLVLTRARSGCAVGQPRAPPPSRPNPTNGRSATRT